MAEITHANQFYTTPSSVFRLWADFWVEVAGRVPPLYHYKNTLKGGFLFVAPLSPPELKPFIEWAEAHPDLYIQNEGGSLLDENTWLGHWGCFSAKVRAVSRVGMTYPTPPTPPPAMPKVPKLPK